MFRRLVMAFLLVTAFAYPLSTSAATLPDEQFTVPKPPTDDRYTGINLDDTQNLRNGFSALMAFTADGTTEGRSWVTSIKACKFVGENGCDLSKYFLYYAQLGYCSSQLTTNCIERVTAKDSSGKEYEGKFVEDFSSVSEYAFTGDKKINLPTSGKSFLVDFPSLSHSGGNQYFVTAGLWGKKLFGANEKFEITNSYAGIFAASKVSGQTDMPKPELFIPAKGTNLGGIAFSGGGWSRDNLGNPSNPSSCLQADLKDCLIAWPLPLNVTFTLTLKMNTRLTGWLNSRIANVSAQISTAPDGDQLVSVSGSPVKVPGIFAWFKKDSLPPSLQKFYANDPNVNRSGGGYGSSFTNIPDGPDLMPYSILKTRLEYDSGSFNEVLAWIDAVSDTAAYAPSVWSFKSMRSNNEFSRCMKDDSTLSGIVSSNASMYVASPPTFDKESQTMDYKVIAPHYLPDKTEFLGVYNLVIKSDVARCLYGYSSAPIKASISIINSSGQTQIATTTFGEKDGWLSLSANGFTFSAPTLRVKLTQEVAVQPGSVVTPPTKAPVTAKKITCAKGKVKKTVTGTKCPSGYKKVA